MDFLVDAQLPPGLARWLNNQGYVAHHVHDLGLQNASDREIWERAATTNSIIVTKDEDFAERMKRTASGPIVVWLRVGNSTNKALTEWIAVRWPVIVQLLADGNRLIEVR